MNLPLIGQEEDIGLEPAVETPPVTAGDSVQEQTPPLYVSNEDITVDTQGRGETTTVQIVDDSPFLPDSVLVENGVNIQPPTDADLLVEYNARDVEMRQEMAAEAGPLDDDEDEVDEAAPYDDIDVSAEIELEDDGVDSEEGSDFAEAAAESHE